MTIKDIREGDTVRVVLDGTAHLSYDGFRLGGFYILPTSLSDSVKTIEVLSRRRTKEGDLLLSKEDYMFLPVGSVISGFSMQDVPLFVKTSSGQFLYLRNDIRYDLSPYCLNGNMHRKVLYVPKIGE